MRKPPVVEIHKPVRRGDRWVAHASVRLPHGEVLRFSASASERLIGSLVGNWKRVVGSHVAFTENGIAFGAIADHPKTVRAMAQAHATRAVGRIAARAASHPYTLAKTPLAWQAKANDVDQAMRLARSLSGVLGAASKSKAAARVRKLASLARRGDAKARGALRLVGESSRALTLCRLLQKRSPSARRSLAVIRRDAARGVSKAVEALKLLRAAKRFHALLAKGLGIGANNAWTNASAAASAPGVETVEEIASASVEPVYVDESVDESGDEDVVEEVEPVASSTAAYVADPIFVPEYDAHGDEDEDEWADVAVGAVFSSRPTERRLTSHAARLLSLFERIRQARAPQTRRVEVGATEFGFFEEPPASHANALSARAATIRAQIPLFASNPMLAHLVPRMLVDAENAERAARSFAVAAPKIAPAMAQNIFRSIAAQRPGSAPAMFGVPSFVPTQYRLPF